jgi:hypothetical protein
LEEKKKVDWKKVLITLALVLLTGVVVGGGVWYYMDQNDQAQQKACDSSINSKQSQIDTLNAKLKESENKVTTEMTPKTTQTDSLTTLQSFCKVSGSTNPDSVSYMQSANGEYGNCGLENAFLIATKVNGTWAKVWAGNGTIDTSLCDQYKIPNKMSGGSCNY